MPELDSINEEEKSVATYLAMVVRNAMEGFHSEHLTDKQMKELNPIIRDAIFTGLHSMRMKNKSSAALNYLEYIAKMVPEYWEEPELLPHYAKKFN